MTNRVLERRALPLFDAVVHRPTAVSLLDDRVRDVITDPDCPPVRVLADDAFAWFLATHVDGTCPDPHDVEGMAVAVRLDMPHISCVAPPFRSLWIEGETRMTVGGTTGMVERVGVFAYWFDIDDPTMVELVVNRRPPTAFDTTGDLADWDTDRARWVLITQTFLRIGTAQAMIGAYTATLVDDVGAVVASALSNSPTADDMDDDVVTLHQGYSVLGLSLACTAVQFLHARNVELVEATQPATARGKKSRRGNLPEYRYHVLDVTGLRRAYAAAGGDPAARGAAEAAVAAHLVRGHLKTYTADRPLLGKHVGTYFWAGHVRGRADRTVEKDYHPATGGVA